MFTVNGKSYEVKNMLLIDFLRDELKLTSVKNGCGTGVCGACTVIIDGALKRSCTLTLEKVDNLKIVTLEGISNKEKDRFASAFAKVGAVQCGFCIPGMMVATKALLDNKPNPTEEEIRKTIRPNLCRCTGYEKIVEAIKLISTGNAIELDFTGGVGSNFTRVDAISKAKGEALYNDDLFFEDMLYVKVKRSDYPRAVIKDIDVSKAKEIAIVLTAEDIPGENYQGYIFKDWPTLVAVGEMTRYIGDAICIVGAKSKEVAKKAIGLIEIEYEVLNPVTNPKKALKSDPIHGESNLLSRTYVERGDVDTARRESYKVYKRTFTTPFTDHAFLEPESSVALYDGILKVYSASQSVYHDHHSIRGVLGIKEDELKVESLNIGGGFGGKEDLSCQHHAALMTYHTKKPSKLTFTREESLLVHPKRHAMDIEMEIGVLEEGRINFLKAKIIADTGAYASLGTAVLERACTHAAGPYKIENVELEGLCVYTNNPPAGAYRGFGVPQSNFARETMIDIIASDLGMSPWDIRYINACAPGDYLPTGQLCTDDVALKETLFAVKDKFENAKFAGIACGHKNTGIGVGLEDVGRANILVKDGKLKLYTSAARIGQGLATAMIQIVKETLGDYDISVENADSLATPDAGATTASRQTLFTGEASRQAALKLKVDLESRDISELEGNVYKGEYSGITDKLGAKEHPVNHVAYSFATQVCILDDSGKIKEVVAAHDVGKAINPINVEGQIEGGVVMSMGYALTENFVLDNGYVKSKFGTLGLLRATDIPKITPIIIEKNESDLAFGAKGIGEISSIPTASAIVNAYYKMDGLERLTLPIDSPYKKHKKS